MLDIDMEFLRGILFVRLTGSLSSDNCIQLEDKVDKLILENGVRFVTFNLYGLDYIDNKGINTILKYNAALSKMYGKALICGLENSLVKLRIHKNDVTYSLYEVRDEISAINYINLGGYL